jgi:hypothetical protein
VTNDKDVLVQGDKKTQTALRILRHIQGCSEGATSDECVVALGVPHQSCSPRFTELVQAGCLKKTGLRRKTASGGYALVYYVADGDFDKYLARGRTARTRDDQILRAGKQFLRAWGPGLAPKQQAKILTRLVRALENADSSA